MSEYDFLSQGRTCHFVDAAQAILQPEGRRPRDGHGPLQGVGGGPVRPQLVGDGGDEAALGEHHSGPHVVEEEAAGAVSATVENYSNNT